MFNSQLKSIKKLIVLIVTFFFQIFTLAQIQKGSDIDGENEGDKSGHSISMPDVNTIAIGSILNSDNGTESGQVRVYRWDGSNWVQKGTDIDGEAANDQSGQSVSMPDPNTVAIGAKYNDGNGSNDIGHVRVFRWDGSNWVQKGTDIDGEDQGDYSGCSVSMPDANTIAIGANFNSGDPVKTQYVAGHVRVYHWDGSNWEQKGSDIDGQRDYDQFGYSVSMSDSNTIAIGAPYFDGTGTGSGHVRVFNWDGSAWVQKGSQIGGEFMDDNSGHSICMPDANTVAIGAPYNRGNGTTRNAGHVRVFNWDGSAWVQKGSDINGAAKDDYSGWSISMSNANTIAVGAKKGSSNVGYVKVYSWNNSNWVQVSKVEGEATGDQSGFSVALPTANTVAIGAIYNDGSATSAGHVRVFNINTLETINKTTCNNYVTPSGKYSYTKSGKYYDTIQNINGCDSVIIINLTINTVDVSITNNSPTLKANASGAIYQWLDCDNTFSPIIDSTSQSFSASSNGNYSVEIKQNGCVDTSLCINVSNANILEYSFDSYLKAIPNPTQGEVKIELGGNYIYVSVIVRNSVGKEVLRKSFNNTNTLEINIPGEAGIYWVEISAQDKKELLKLMMD